MLKVLIVSSEGDSYSVLRFEEEHGLQKFRLFLAECERTPEQIKELCDEFAKNIGGYITYKEYPNVTISLSEFNDLTEPLVDYDMLKFNSVIFV